MGELYRETLHTEGTIWGGHTRESLIENIRDGLTYLTSADLVNMHSEISTIQLSRACLKEYEDPDLKQLLHDALIMSYSRWGHSDYYTYWNSSEADNKEDEIFTCHYDLERMVNFTYTECKQILQWNTKNGTTKIPHIYTEELKGYMAEFIKSVDHHYIMKLK